MRNLLDLDPTVIEECRRLAAEIAREVTGFARARTTTSIERATLRWMGVEGADPEGVPLVNRVVEEARQAGALGLGIAIPFAGAMVRSGLSPQEAAQAIADGRLSLDRPPESLVPKCRSLARDLAEAGARRVQETVRQREQLIRDLGEGPHPLLYVIVASGNIYEDTLQAKVCVQAGAQVIAVIRSTAQSLLDYIPEGATTEGYGGTYATQMNFRIMRQALDEASRTHGRYVRLCNYASGLCMPEMSALGALERLDVMLNDALYGILFRDINMQRTLTDQAFSRRISAAAGIIINTGEDNYLTTADAFEAGHTVLASEFINEQIGLRCGLRPEQLGLGHAMQMNPWQEDMLLWEIAQAQLVREVFPRSPIKYMPPTRYMTGDIFRGHVQDALFNLVSVWTGQGIHLLGMMTEAMHTPHVHDRVLALESARMIQQAARHLEEEVRFQPDGRIQRRAREVLDRAEALLRQVRDRGLFQALAEGVFADIPRSPEGGRGLDGVALREPDYENPVEEVLDRMTDQEGDR
ncbi:MAG TPA: lysine 5,6-aminomutase subunit alpha [Myxococcota bacterium]|nr:lysine 5,6-aminomutase subunit alpha [Myxococcota bacterium]HQK50055.1 lysine 5,6-aminomutase subunit alpha [Myxococcota bacterium]